MEIQSLAVMVSATFIFCGFLGIQLASCSSQTVTYSTVTDKGICKHRNGDDIVLCEGYQFESDLAGCKTKCTSFGPCVGIIVSDHPEKQYVHCYLIPSEKNCPQEFNITRTESTTTERTTFAKTPDDLVVHVIDERYSCYSKNPETAVTKPEEDDRRQSTGTAAHESAKPEEEKQSTKTAAKQPTKTAATGIATNVIVSPLAVVLTIIPFLYNV